jgi:cell division protein FtsI/penicillin-binding protein 2
MHPLFFTPGLRNLNDGSRFAVSTAPGDPFISAAALDNLRTLMAATIESGTARKGFRRAFGSRSINGLDLGGKTGSLDGSDPPGRYEWYIGYARLKEKPGQGIAVVAMVINQRQRMVRASELAALMIRDWAHIPPAPARARYKKIRHPAYARR